MSFTAISIGYAVPTRGFDAAVHSAFQSALNLRLRAEDGLLTLLASSEGDLPQGIRLDTRVSFPFEGFQAGEKAVCKDGILHFENRSLTVQLNSARRWKCDLPALEFDPSKSAVSTAWDFVWHLLNKRQRLTGSEIVADELFHLNEPGQASVSYRMGEALRGLFKATRQYDFTGASAGSGLIGLGTGLTPSGDDLLVGYMAGLRCTIQHRIDRAQFISTLGKSIIQLSYRTGDISRTYLYHAAQGQVSSHLANLAASICRGDDTRQIDQIAETAMRVGHTSGMDAVSGLLIGLRVWDGNSLIKMP